MEPAKLNPTIPDDGTLEIHPLVSLVIARMESHPKEFYKFDPTRMNTTNTNTTVIGARINQFLESTKSLWNREEKRLYNLALRKVRMGEAHERLMAILLTGDTK